MMKFYLKKKHSEITQRTPKKEMKDSEFQDPHL